MNESQQQNIYRCLSQLLDYPTPNLVAQTQTCIELLKISYPKTVLPMEGFLKAIESTKFGRLEEIYTGTFDISPACHIYAGHILFGESFKRGRFMAELTEEYQKRHFELGKELADYIPLLLKFLCTLDSKESIAQDLLNECLIPVFEKMNDNFKDESTNPYVPVLRTVSVVLQG
ncbi:MAG: molecular chaperone TorD family protein [Thiomargarita sp.]|nr:molecular chaperone TorD family protein [Thiomargarita sp.]